MGATAIYYLTIFMGYSVTAAKQFWAQIPLFVSTAIASTLACYFLVPDHGISGAAVSEVITQMTALTGGLIIILFAIKYTFKTKAD